ncbi:MAG: 5-(carboxyamino)imidazole ribonucleotide mutase [Treponema sp.]|nr:MAG: 5-(carboxyamino)imidazole ribonucleotide mutase [Treponema sp.]
MENKPLCIIIMGSASDKPHAKEIADAVESFGIDCEVRIGSAHKTPEHVLTMLKEYEKRDCPKVYITIAGRSNALSGFVDACVLSPTVACPPKSDSFAGSDIFSSLRMPSGVSPAVVLEPKNAALLVAKIFAVSNKNIYLNIKQYIQNNADKIISDDEKLKK